MVDLVQVCTFFFKAMREGWATGVEKVRIADMPGYKAIPFRDGDFYLLDRYCVTPRSAKSAGTTTIWFRDVPVWVMNYGGSYEEGVVAVVKRALRKTYERDQFIGGRGPFIYSEGNLVYVNVPRRNDFAAFEGREEVLDNEGGTSLGFHDYCGMSLL